MSLENQRNIKNILFSSMTKKRYLLFNVFSVILSNIIFYLVNSHVFGYYYIKPRLPFIIVTTSLSALVGLAISFKRHRIPVIILQNCFIGYFFSTLILFFRFEKELCVFSLFTVITIVVFCLILFLINSKKNHNVALDFGNRRRRLRYRKRKFSAGARLAYFMTACLGAIFLVIIPVKGYADEIYKTTALFLLLERDGSKEPQFDKSKLLKDIEDRYEITVSGAEEYKLENSNLELLNCFLDELSWKTLSSEEKKEALLLLMKIQASKIAGVPEPFRVNVTVCFSDLFNQSLKGEYCRDYKTIILNETILKETARDAGMTALHELRHHWQHAMIELYEEMEDEEKQLFLGMKIFDQEMKNYISGRKDEENYKSYAEQVVETDARFFSMMQYEIFLYDLRGLKKSDFN